MPHPLLWRWRRNPLRRRADLVQGWIAVGLFLAVLTATPAAVVLVGDTARRHLEQTARHQAGTRHSEPGSDVWISDAGELTDAPLTQEEIRDHARGYAVLAAVAVPLTGTAAYIWAHRRLERHNLAQWGAAWARTAPRWPTSP
ncbi:hypothetical protein [Streptomyces sp. NPDC057302]|uniref:hypothetical protein n=1 Tax=Streptomyces sp. NPDC057302 TaxID=3346094 RepID=UPI003639CE3D